MVRVTGHSIDPIVFAVAGDPFNTGLVDVGTARQQRHRFVDPADGDRYQTGRLLRELVPNLRRLAIAANAANPAAVLEMGDILETHHRR